MNINNYRNSALLLPVGSTLAIMCPSADDFSSFLNALDKLVVAIAESSAEKIESR